MRNTFKITLILTILLINAVITGCGQVLQQTDEKSTSTTAITQTSATKLTYDFDITSTTDNVYSIGFSITNTNSVPATITFPCSPANYKYEILDNQGIIVASEQTSVLDSLYTVTIAPGASYKMPPIEFTKQSNSTYLIKNTIKFYSNQELTTKEISNLF